MKARKVLKGWRERGRSKGQGWREDERAGMEGEGEGEEQTTGVEGEGEGEDVLQIWAARGRPDLKDASRAQRAFKDLK